MGSLYPLSLLDMSMQISESVWNDWQQILLDNQRRREAELQQALLVPSGHTEDEGRIFPRINRVSAAVRAFFAHNQSLTLYSDYPFIRQQELRMLRIWVHAFQLTEHAIRREVRVPLEVWREDRSYRDELAELASDDPHVFGLVATVPALQQGARQVVTRQLCGQLMDMHARHQME